MSRRAALLIVLALWAAIYLPALGSLEIKGEEGRRILPAITMLRTGHYLVPQIGSEPYFRKPPLVNWLVAASFQLTGTRNEWTARAPSVLSVLAVALAFIFVARRTLGAGPSLVAAVIWLTNFGVIEKGRLIEIEALYVALFGLAFVCWLSWWEERRSPWLTWTVPWIFLGLGLLAKGPLLLLFFYAIVVAILVAARESRQLWRAPHLLGVAIMLGLFAAWAIPCLQSMHATPVAGIWTRQLSGRLGGSDFKLGSWLLNLPRAFAYFLPWLLLAPLLRPRVSLFASPVFRAVFFGAGAPFLLLLLLPSALPRYAMPLLVPACWLLAIALRESDLAWFGRKFARPPWPWIIGITAASVALCVLVYASAIVPKLQRREKVRTIARQIDGVLGDGQTLFAVDPDYQPFLFYLRSRLEYVSELTDLPADARFVLVQPANEAGMNDAKRWAPRTAKALLRTTDYRSRSVILFQID